MNSNIEGLLGFIATLLTTNKSPAGAIANNQQPVCLSFVPAGFGVSHHDKR